ncbi:hypothetical protein H2204_004967 [Knufia peltigerae]|uniref:Uncharacterized protein n=1 Tax=Knufia peltigerae TaxID=1002370 RepID=A0AA39CYX6_9EURO|nr:hypothetical protein H2204_004967 [Knufia peltigerae]
MPYLAVEHYPIPTTDLLTWMFDAKVPYEADKALYIDARDPSRSISCRLARQIVRRLAAGFRKAGVYYPMAFLGIIAAGAIFAGLNPSYTVPEMVHAVKTADITHFLAEPEFLPKVTRAAAQCSIPSSHIFAFDTLGQSIPPKLDIKSWKVLQVPGEEADWERFDDRTLSEKTIAARLFSSGTTGLPKALNVSMWNLVAQHTLVMEASPRPYEVRRLISNPMFHASQVPRVHTSVIRSGHVSYIMRRFEMKPWLRNISRFNITEVNIVPMMVITLLASRLLSSEEYSLKSLRYAWAGSAPLDKDTQARFKKHLRPDTPFNQAWGMSETTCIATWFDYPEQDLTGSVGRLLANCDAKIVDDFGNDISGDKDKTGADVRGELCVRGPIIVPGYHRNPDANHRDWDSDGYFHTGDIAFCDSNTKKWYIVGRKKELIKVRGFQVAPTELESVLRLHPKIADCAVFGVQRSTQESELPAACIVLQDRCQMAEDEVHEYTRARLAGYKQLRGGVRFISALPRNANGKVMKNDLKKMLMSVPGTESKL